MTPRLSVVIVNLRPRVALERCLASLEGCRERMPLDVVVVSADAAGATPDGVLPRTWVEGIPGAELGFTRAVNLGFARAGGDAILLLDSACTVRPEALERLVRA